MTDRIIRPNELCEILGVSKPTLYRYISAGELPPRIKLSKTGSAVGWRESTINEWLDEKEAETEIQPG